VVDLHSVVVVEDHSVVVQVSVNHSTTMVHHK
jgi:hypothetical protein